MPTQFIPTPVPEKKKVGQGASMHFLGGGSDEYHAATASEETQKRLQEQRARGAGAQQGPQGSPVLLPPLDKHAANAPGNGGSISVAGGSGGGSVSVGGGTSGGGGGSGSGGTGGGLGGLSGGGGFRSVL